MILMPLQEPIPRPSCDRCESLRRMMHRALTPEEKRALSAYIPRIDLDRAVLHEGCVPWYLPRRFSGIVRGHHVYFRAGAYHADTLEGIALLGHELTHVYQYRSGMTVLTYLLSTLHGYSNSRYERAAYSVQARIRKDLESGRVSPRLERGPVENDLA